MKDRGKVRQKLNDFWDEADILRKTKLSGSELSIYTVKTPCTSKSWTAEILFIKSKKDDC